ncbi:hypothetical protein RGUI_4298 (plasmid) [Rhodovulum sp. P5]|nr:hypothetical protein RGUI_4298 [Rhodovulum sp. P5]
MVRHSIHPACDWALNAGGAGRFRQAVGRRRTCAGGGS